LKSSASKIGGKQTVPKSRIETDKLRTLGMEFGGVNLLKQTVAELVGLNQNAKTNGRHENR
jgi:hypothetical protein